MIISFELNEKESLKADRWRKSHKYKCTQTKIDNFTGRKFIEYSFEFCPTGIGVAVIIKCRNCKKESNITDYNSW